MKNASHIYFWEITYGKVTILSWTNKIDRLPAIGARDVQRLPAPEAIVHIAKRCIDSKHVILDPQLG